MIHNERLDEIRGKVKQGYLRLSDVRDLLIEFDILRSALLAAKEWVEKEDRYRSVGGTYGDGCAAYNARDDFRAKLKECGL